MGLQGVTAFTEMYYPTACMALGLKCVAVDHMRVGRPDQGWRCGGGNTGMERTTCGLSYGWNASPSTTPPYDEYVHGTHHCLLPLVLHPVKK